MKYFLTDTPQNLVRFSSDVSSWVSPTSYACTAEKGYPAPDGSMDAWRIETNSSSPHPRGYRYIITSYASIPSLRFSSSFYVKKGSAKFTSFSILFDLGTPTEDVATINWNDLSLSHTPILDIDPMLEPVSNDWFKLTFFNTTSYTNARVVLVIYPNGIIISSADYGYVEIFNPGISEGYSELPVFPNSSSESLNPFSSQEAIELQPLPGIVTKSSLYGKDHKTLSGRILNYNEEITTTRKFKLDWVDSSAMCRVNSWWGANTNLVFQDTAAGDVTSCRIINKNAPIFENDPFHPEYFKGVLELETY